MIPEHRKFRESFDFTITKTIISEGDLSSWQPRFGSSGSMIFRHACYAHYVEYH